MGRELQKRKNRSSVSKVKRKPKSKKRFLAHPIIAENWDKSQTLSQNYKRLGLTAKLNKCTGGVEKKVSDVLRERDVGEGNWSNDLQIVTSAKRKEKLDVTEAKIERDPETGKILRVLDQATETPNPLDDPLNDLDSDSDSHFLSSQNQHGNVDPAAASAGDEGKTETVKRLEAEAARPAARYKRKQPEGERLFVEELVSKYGDDYSKMARDIKINYMQRSEGDIKRRVKKWRESGGRID